MKLYFIRHGQTTHNAAGRCQGWSPVRLSELGMEQARAAREYVGKILFDRIHCSDLLRTKQTCELIFPEAYKAKQILFEEDLREINNTIVAGRKSAEMIEIYGETYRQCPRNLDYSLYGGESSAHLRERVARFMDRVRAEAEAEGLETIAAVAHGGVIHAAFTNVCGAPPEVSANQIPFIVDNCSVHVFEWRQGKWWIKALNYRGEGTI